MASFRKRGDRWQARVIRFGCPDQVKTFTTKQDAECWARSVETEIDKGLLVDRRLADRTTLASILERYAVSVCPTKRGGVIEGRRLLKMARDRIGKLSISRLTPQAVADYRDRRKAEVCDSTLNRELQLLGSVLNHANREWGIEFLHNPVYRVRIPPPGKHRTRILSVEEESRLMASLDGAGYRRVPKATHNPWVKPIVQLAIETACRRGEILSMKWEDIDLVNRTVVLHFTKNGDDRVVPLSSKAVQVLDGLTRDDSGVVFP